MKKLVIMLSLVLISVSLSGCTPKDNNNNETVKDKTPIVNNDTNNEDEDKEIKVTKMPSWVKDLWITEPKWMKLVESDVDSEGWYNAIMFSYESDYDKAMSEAKRIAEKAGIPVSAEFQMAQDLSKTMWFQLTPEMEAEMQMAIPKWIIYTNFTFMSGKEELLKKDDKYQVAIQVEETETGALLNISAADINFIDTAVKIWEDFDNEMDDQEFDMNFEDMNFENINFEEVE